MTSAAPRTSSPVEQEYLRRTPKSAELAEQSLRVMPGGDTRSAAHHAPYTLTFSHGQGERLVDVDGNDYVDLAGNYTSLVHGYGFAPVVEAISAVAQSGTAWPARALGQLDLGQQLIDRVASVDLVRFANSGTEANMLAVRLARVVTGRSKVLMARHGYHGGYDDLEIGLAGLPGPRTLLATYGVAAEFEEVLAEQGDDVALVILEPVMGAGGIVPAPEGFLQRVADAARAAGALFVLDEVICLRLAPGGAQALHGVTPDLTSFGKIIGGGLPVGALGGRADLMARLDPRLDGYVFHSGTFNGNPLTMAAGAATMQALTPHRLDEMARLAVRLRDGLTRLAAQQGLPFSVRGTGSLMNVYFSEEPPAATLLREDAALMRMFHLAGLNRGLFFASRGMMVLSTPMTDATVDEVLQRADCAFADVAAEADRLVEVHDAVPHLDL